MIKLKDHVWNAYLTNQEALGEPVGWYPRYIGQTIKEEPEDRFKEHNQNLTLVIRGLADDPTLDRTTKAYLAVRNSMLYNTMAEWGRDAWECVLVRRVLEGEDMNALERHYIKEYATRYPHGLNSTDGGDSKYNHTDRSRRLMKQTKAERIENNRSRQPELKGMPMYTYWIGLEGKERGFQIKNHPQCKHASFFVKKHGSFEAARKACLDLHAALDKDKTFVYSKKKDTDLPRGIKKHKLGYLIDMRKKLPNGETKTWTDRFTQRTMTDEEKRAAAKSRHAEILLEIAELVKN